MNQIVKIESHLPAASFELDGKFWLACGAQWIEVDHVYTAEELKEAWVRKPQTYDAPIKKEPVSPPKSYEVVGSKGNTYTVTYKAGKWDCTCPSASFHRHSECKHVRSIKEQNQPK